MTASKWQTHVLPNSGSDLHTDYKSCPLFLKRQSFHAFPARNLPSPRLNDHRWSGLVLAVDTVRGSSGTLPDPRSGSRASPRGVRPLPPAQSARGRRVRLFVVQNSRKTRPRVSSRFLCCAVGPVGGLLTHRRVRTSVLTSR